MFNKILPFIFLLSILVNAQDEYKPLVKAERQRYLNLKKMSEVQYPGDSKIDVTYYGLDLTITSNPNYLIGNITIGAKSDTIELNSCFLDLRDFLMVDSIQINGNSTSFVHSDNKINITLDHTYSMGEAFTLNVYYRGVPSGTNFGGFYFQTQHNVSGAPVIISTLNT